MRLDIGLQHAHPRLAEVLERSVRRVGTSALLFFALQAWEQEFLVPSMAFNTANAYDIVCRLDRDDTPNEVPQNKKQKITTGLLLDKLQKQDFAGPLSSRASRVLGPISRHRVVDTLHYMKLLVSFESYVIGCALHRDFTLKSMITPAVLDAQMNLTLFHTTMNVPSCTTFCFFLETCYDIATFFTWLDHPSVPAMHSIWYCGSGLP